MTRRLWPLLLIPILVVWLALPRDFPATSEAFVPGLSGGGSSAASLVTGAPSVPEVLDSGDGQPGPAPSGAVSNTRSGPSGAPTPSQKLGDFSSYQKPTPQPRIVDGISGWATYWNSFGSGFYAALRPDLGGRGDIAIVCGGSPWHCKSVNVITTCACGDRHGKPTLIDLSLDFFREFADPSLGVVKVVIQVVRE